MRAFVFSGGGNLGPIQVGALRALLERALFPEIIVGCSAGALNAAYLAREVSLEQVERLADLWRSVRLRDVYPGSRLAAIWRFLSGKDSLYDNRSFYSFLQRHGSTPMETFDSMTDARLFITATHLRTGRMHVFGDNGHDRVLDALMASTALPPMHPPWLVDGEQYIDGGTVTPLPVRVALERGATEIFSLHIDSTADELPENGLVRGVLRLMNRSVNTMLHLQAEHDLLLARAARRVRMHHMPLRVASPPGQTDFSQADRLMDQGFRIAGDYLDAAEKSGSIPSARSGMRFGLAQFLQRSTSSPPTAARDETAPQRQESAELKVDSGNETV